jgi:gliding motility-associated lipoprotein GldD
MNKNNNTYIFLLILAAFALLQSCEQDYTPKPRAYFRLDMPAKEYRPLQTDCPFTFDYPVYADVNPDKDGMVEPCWMNIDYPNFNARIHLSYKPVASNLDKFLEDSRTLTYKHTSKATDIREHLIVNREAKVYGLIYDVKGDAASSLQFFVTDSTRHFVRGALYFNVVPNQDSLSPVIDLIRSDVTKLIDTFQWK